MKFNATNQIGKPLTRLEGLLEAWAVFLSKHPEAIFAICLLVTILAVPNAYKLDLVWSEEALFPSGKVTLEERASLDDRLGGMGVLVGLIEGGSFEDRKSYSDALARQLSEQRDKLKKSGQNSMYRYLLHKIPLPFFQSRRLLYLQEKDLLHIEMRLNKRMAQERLKKNPFYINLEELEEPEVDISFQDLHNKYGVKYFQEYPMSADGSILAMIIKPALPSYTKDFPAKLIKWINSNSADLLKDNFYPGIKFTLGGSYVEHAQSRKKLEKNFQVSVLFTLIAFSLLVLMIFRSFKPLLTLLFFGFVTLAWLRACAYIIFGAINIQSAAAIMISTGFGLSYGLVLYYCYVEARRNNFDAQTSLILATVKQGRILLIIGISTAIFMLINATINLTDYKVFGVLGSLGVCVVLISFFTLYLSTIALWEKHYLTAVGAVVKIGNVMPRKITRGKGILAICIFFAGIGFVFQIQSYKSLKEPWCNELERCCPGEDCCDPKLDFDYDFHYLKSGNPAAMEFNSKLANILHLHRKPVVIIANSRDSLENFLSDLNKLKQNTTSMIQESTIRESMIQGFTSFRSFVPSNQAKKKVILERIDQLATNKNIEFLDRSARKKIHEIRPLLHPSFITLYQLPIGILRTFSEQPKGGEDLAQILSEALVRLPDDLEDSELELAIRQHLDQMNERAILTIYAQAKNSEMADFIVNKNENIDLEQKKQNLKSILVEFHNHYIGTVAYIYPRIDTLYGMAAINLNRELKPLLEKHPSIIVAGDAINLGNSLEEIRSSMVYVYIYILLAAILIIIMTLKSPLMGLTTLLPSCVSFSIMAFGLGLFGIKYNIFSLMGIPLIMGLGLDFSLRIYCRYLEERQIGALPAVIKSIIPIMLMFSPVALLFAGWLFNPQQSISIFGAFTLGGLLLTVLMSLTFYPALLEVIHSRLTNKNN